MRDAREISKDRKQTNAVPHSKRTVEHIEIITDPSIFFFKEDNIINQSKLLVQMKMLPNKPI